MRIVIDTNTYRAFADKREQTVQLFRSATELLLPVPVIAELRFGFMNGSKGRKNEAYLTQFMDSSRVKILDCDEETTFHFASLKLQLKKQGTPIPINDVWIAALTIQHFGILHTLDSDFDNISQLARI